MGKADQKRAIVREALARRHSRRPRVYWRAIGYEIAVQAFARLSVMVAQDIL